MLASQSQLFSPMHRCLRQFQILAEEATSTWEIAADEGHALMYVAAYGPCPISELVRVLGFRPSTLTNMVRRLEARNLLTVVPGRDRRRRLLQVSTQGKRAAEQFRSLGLALEEQILSQVSHRDYQGFQRLLQAISTTLGVQVRPPAPGGTP